MLQKHCVFSVKVAKAFKMHESERGEVDFDLCFLSKSERRPPRSDELKSSEL